MKTFTLIDIETTGFSAKTCEITEIGAIKVNAKTLEVIDQFEFLIDIEASIVPLNITRLTGINKRMLNENGLPIDMVLEKLVKFCSDDDIYAHYSTFDKSFIRHYLDKYNIKYPKTKWVDTIPIFKKYFPNRQTYKLESLIQDFNLASKEDHRAISDAKHTLQLLRIAKKGNNDLKN